MYRPKHFLMIYAGKIYKIHIYCYPQSRWELVSETYDKVTLKNKHTIVDLTREDFEKCWVKVEKK